MLVFKRALSLALSAMLACPASAFARNEKSNSRRGFVPAASAFERSRTKGVSRRQPTSISPQQMSPGLALASVMPKSMGKRRDVQVVEVKGKGNRLKSRTITKPGYQELIVDNDGDGKADVFEVTRGAVTVKSYRPYLGQFTHMDFTERRVKGEIKSSLVFSSRTKRYELVSIEFVPYKAQLDPVTNGSVKVGDMCSDDASKLASFEELLKQIKDSVGGEKSLALNCKLQTYQDLFFDKSCNSGEFASSKNDMIRGLSKIMASRDANTSGRPQYLQCLEQNGYGYHSAKIQDILAQKLVNARNKMATAANWTDADFMNKSCEPIEKVEIQKPSGGTTKKKFTDLVLDDSKAPKLISCQNDSRCWGKHFEESNTISMCSTSSQISAGYGTAAEDAYGSVMFHELLHASGMSDDDEPLIKDMQNCCAPNKYTAQDTDNACALVKKRSTDDRFMAVLSQSAMYVEYRRYLVAKLGSVKADEYLRALAIGFKDSPEGMSELRTFDQCSKNSVGDVNKAETCKKNLLYAVGKFTHKFTNEKMCGVWAVTAPNVKCNEIVEISDQTFQYSVNDIVVSAGGSRNVDLLSAPPAIITEISALDVSPALTLDFSAIAATIPPLTLDNTDNGGRTNFDARPKERTAPVAPANPQAGTETPAPSTIGGATTTTGGATTTGRTSTTGGATTTGGTTPSTTAPTAPTEPRSGTGIGYVDPTQPATNPTNTNNPANPTTGDRTAPSKPTNGNGSTTAGGGETGGTNAPTRTSGNSNLVGGLGATGNTYVSPTSRTAAASAASARALDMPTAALPSASTLGTGSIDFASTRAVDTTLNAASSLGSLASKLVLASPNANASAQQIARSAPISSPSVATWASSASSGSRSIAAVRSGSSSASSSGSRVTAAQSKTQAGSKSQGASASQNGAAPSEGQGDAVAQADGAEAEEADQDATARDGKPGEVRGTQATAAQSATPRALAAAPGGNSAASGQTWKSGTFRSKFEARKFVTAAPAERIIELSSSSNSAFARDLASKQIGIQLGGGKVVGYSQPTHQICGKRVVGIGECR